MTSEDGWLSHTAKYLKAPPIRRPKKHWYRFPVIAFTRGDEL